jgi:hypothetical protein
MIISMIKFGDMLISRPAGREAFLAGKSYLFSAPVENESIVLDFKSIKVLTPSWADEFISGIKALYSNRLEVSNVDSPAVKASLDMVLS